MYRKIDVKALNFGANGQITFPDGSTLNSNALDADGFVGKRVVRATHLVDAIDGTAIGTHGLGITLPAHALITRAFYYVKTTFTSATDAATIALQTGTDTGNIKAAVAISNGANPWDAGAHEGIPDGTAATFAAVSAESELKLVVAVEKLTAGKLHLFVEYVIVS